MANSRPTVSPTIKRAYTYLQMLAGALTIIGGSVAVVYAFLDDYAKDAEVTEAIRKHSMDIVETPKAPLPHNNRFSKIELELKAIRESQSKDQEIITLLKSTDVETMKILVRRIVADMEPDKRHRMNRGAMAEDVFEYWLKKEEPPIEALRKAVRACGRGGRCYVP